MKAHKCVICGNPIENAADEIPFKSRYSHKTCFDAYMKASTEKKVKEVETKKKAAENKGSKAKSQTEVKGKLSEEEFQEKKQYFDFLREMTGLEVLPPKMYKISEDYIKKYGMTYDGMRITLLYIAGMQNKEFNDSIIGLIPYYYGEAIKLNEEYKKESIELPVDEVYKRKVVKIRPPKSIPDLIDIEGLGSEDTK